MRATRSAIVAFLIRAIDKNGAEPDCLRDRAVSVNRFIITHRAGARVLVVELGTIISAS